MNKLSMVLCTAYFAAALLFLEFPSDSGYHGRFLLSESHQTVLDDEATTNAMFFSGRPIYIVGLIIAFIGIMLSAGGGIGGGGLLVPIFVLIFRLPIKHAVGLSNVTVFGGAVANTILNASKRHPLANRPLVDWNLLSMMEPLTMAGALVGAGINQSLPDVMVVIMLVLLLGVTTMMTLRKANQMHAIETDQRTENCQMVALLSSTTGSCRSPLYGSSSYDVEIVSKTVPTMQLLQLLEEESRAPWIRITQVSVLFLTVSFLNLLKGGGGDNLEWLPLQVTCGSIVFFSLDFANISIIALFAIYIRRALIKETSKKQSLLYEFVDGDIIWDETNTWKYSGICSIAGLFAGLFGIGGGIIKSPLMLEMGVHPTVASATSSAMILFTSFTAMTSYFVHGKLNYQDAAVCAAGGFGSTFLGQLCMQALLAKSNRHSYIAYSMGLVIGLSAVAMTVESIVSLFHGTDSQESGLCSDSG